MIKFDTYLDRYLCIFVVPRLPKQAADCVVYVHKPVLGHQDQNLPINR